MPIFLIEKCRKRNEITGQLEQLDEPIILSKGIDVPIAMPMEDQRFMVVRRNLSDGEEEKQGDVDDQIVDASSEEDLTDEDHGPNS